VRYQFLLFITIVSFSIIFAACGSQTGTDNSVSSNAPNVNAGVNNSNGSIPTTKKPETATTNNAPTLAPVMTAYYEALKKKDDAALRKVVSQNTLKTWEIDMKAEKKTSLAAFLTEIEPVPEKAFEVRNENIEGDSAIAEIKGGVYAVWTRFKFVRENGEWKITNQSPDFKDVEGPSTESKPEKSKSEK
jgi:hypothetical protein